MGHGKSLGSFDGPPIFWYVHGWAIKEKSMLIIYYIKILIIKVNKLSKLSNANDAIEASTLFYTTTRTGRITANTTNWRAAQYRYC
jgi:hypothetical protein